MISVSSLNPLFIRSQFQIKGSIDGVTVNSYLVSIPYSSGLSFRSLYSYNKTGNDYVARSQSLIHQVSVSDSTNWANGDLGTTFGLNPLFIRSQFQMAAFFQPINTDSYNGLFCNLSFSSLFSSLHRLIPHHEQQFLSAITNNCKFPVTTPLFWPFFNFVQLSKLYTHPALWWPSLCRLP